ncbi:MAG: hypothetical protein JWQ27_2058 [Ferruginibacter sp.]|nr:hypothetical protein [Ferruginibacter sp.]
MGSYFKTAKLSLINERMPEWNLWKINQRDRFLEHLGGKVKKAEIDSFLNFNGTRGYYFDSTKLEFPLISASFFNSEFKKQRIIINHKVPEKSVIEFPVLAVSEPYFFCKGQFCIVSIAFQPAFTIGSLGYYLFKKNITGKWEFDGTVVETVS